MTTVTIPERIPMNEGVETAQLFDFTLKKYYGPRAGDT